jgi:hypothetical protein
VAVHHRLGRSYQPQVVVAVQAVQVVAVQAGQEVQAPLRQGYAEPLPQQAVVGAQDEQILLVTTAVVVVARQVLHTARAAMAAHPEISIAQRVVRLVVLLAVSVVAWVALAWVDEAATTPVAQ